MIRYLLVVDLEGIFGVNRLADDIENKRLVLKQLEVTFDCLTQYSQELSVVVCMIHNDGKLLNTKDFPNEWISFYEGFSSLLTEDIRADYCLLLGFHSKAGGVGVFPHSFRDEIQYIKMGDREIGEVFLYSALINNMGTKIIFASGEGYFDDELIDSDIVTCIDEISYTDKLMLSLNKRHEPCKRILTGELRIAFREKNIALYVQEKYGYNGNVLAVSSVEVFFRELLAIAKILNDYRFEERQKNISFMKKLGSMHLEKAVIGELLPFLGRDVLDFTREDREKVNRILANHYEDIRTL